MSRRRAINSFAKKVAILTRWTKNLIPKLIKSTAWRPADRRSTNEITRVRISSPLFISRNVALFIFHRCSDFFSTGRKKGKFIGKRFRFEISCNRAWKETESILMAATRAKTRDVISCGQHFLLSSHKREKRILYVWCMYDHVRMITYALVNSSSSCGHGGKMESSMWSSHSRWRNKRQTNWILIIFKYHYYLSRSHSL